MGTKAWHCCSKRELQAKYLESQAVLKAKDAQIRHLQQVIKELQQRQPPTPPAFESPAEVAAFLKGLHSLLGQILHLAPESKDFATTATSTQKSSQCGVDELVADDHQNFATPIPSPLEVAKIYSIGDWQDEIVPESEISDEESSYSLPEVCNQDNEQEEEDKESDTETESFQNEIVAPSMALLTLTKDDGAWQSERDEDSGKFSNIVSQDDPMPSEEEHEPVTKNSFPATSPPSSAKWISAPSPRPMKKARTSSLYRKGGKELQRSTTLNLWTHGKALQP